MIEQQFPPGWDLQRVQNVISHYDNISEQDLADEDNGFADPEGETLISVPTDLLPKIDQLIDQHLARTSTHTKPTPSSPQAPS